jgi:hypothetical protein
MTDALAIELWRRGPGPEVETERALEAMVKLGAARNEAAIDAVLAGWEPGRRQALTEALALVGGIVSRGLEAGDASGASPASSDLLAPWKARISAAVAAWGDRPLHLQTWLTHNEVMTRYSGQKVTLVAPIIECGKGYDEEALPFFDVQALDGARLVADDQELFSHDSRWFEVVAAVTAGFAVARKVGYVGPYDFDERASPEERERFAEAVQAFVLPDGWDDAPHTPDAFRGGPAAGPGPGPR